MFELVESHQPVSGHLSHTGAALRLETGIAPPALYSSRKPAKYESETFDAVAVCAALGVAAATRHLWLFDQSHAYASNDAFSESLPESFGKKRSPVFLSTSATEHA